MPTPSLLIVPARFKTGRLYSQIPTSGAGDFTVTRATTATRVNASGLIESVASGIPRLDYFASGGTVGCPALLVEPAATNLVLRSEEFNVSGTWTPISGGTGLLPVITANAVVAPDGTTTADTIVFDRNAVSGTANFSQLQQSVNFPTSGTYTFGVYAKATTSGDVGKQFYIRTRNALVSGSLTSSWVRYTSTETGLSSGVNTVFIGNRGGFTADQTVSVDLWGAQLETGSVATSYIPTTTGTGSRSADVISVSGAVSGSIGQTEGTIYVEGVITNYADAAASFIAISDNTINNRLEIRKGSPGSIIFERASATQSASTSINATGQGNGVFKMAVAYKSGDTAFFINGVQVATTNAATFTMNTLTHIYLGSNASGTARWLNDRIRAAAIYTTRLSNAQLAALTTP